MNRKIDDQLLLNLIEQGVPQKTIAVHMNCSPAAISKRLKRLSSAPENVLEDFNLTEKEKTFCVEKAKGATNTKAALSAYEAGSMASAKAIGSQLMKKHEVRQAIDELMEEHGLTKSYRVRKLKQHVDNRDPNVSLKALDQSWRLDGSYAPEKHEVLSITATLELTEQAYKDLIASKYPETDRNS